MFSSEAEVQTKKKKMFTNILEHSEKVLPIKHLIIQVVSLEMNVVLGTCVKVAHCALKGSAEKCHGSLLRKLQPSAQRKITRHFYSLEQAGTLQRQERTPGRLTLNIAIFHGSNVVGSGSWFPFWSLPSTPAKSVG